MIKRGKEQRRREKKSHQKEKNGLVEALHYNLKDSIEYMDKLDNGDNENSVH